MENTKRILPLKFRYVGKNGVDYIDFSDWLKNAFGIDLDGVRQLSYFDSKTLASEVDWNDEDAE